MNKMMQKFVDQEFCTEKEGEYMLKAIENKEVLMISGHRSAGVRPFMASCMAIAKGEFNAVQVKKEEDLEKECDFFLIPSIPGIDFEELMQKAVATGKGIVTVKEPETPYSIMKILKKNFKANGQTNQVFHMIECNKEDGIPFVQKVTKLTQNEKGKILKEDLE
ncbi:hypothetical protein [Mediannikoviicoccus vaginalis]|uniref:hypothetical protein n=1 Tax=Mediannikoviicoccus vaginalis TaxID=2899727 RepID=UPI001F25F5ED|nr:hypothetical protein [Mediannikoviicoccus vaginalis]